MSQPQTAPTFATSGSLSAYESAAFSPVNGYHQLKPVPMENLPAELEQRLPSIGSLFTSSGPGSPQATVSVSSRSFLELLTTDSGGGASEPQLQAQLATFDSYLDALRQGMEASHTPVSAADHPSMPSPQAGSGAPDARVSALNVLPEVSDAMVASNPLLPFNSWDEVLLCAFRQNGTRHMSVAELCDFVKRLFPCFKDGAEKQIAECLQTCKLFTKAINTSPTKTDLWCMSADADLLINDSPSAIPESLMHCRDSLLHADQLSGTTDPPYQIWSEVSGGYKDQLESDSFMDLPVTSEGMVSPLTSETMVSPLTAVLEQPKPKFTLVKMDSAHPGAEEGKCKGAISEGTKSSLHDMLNRKRKAASPLADAGSPAKVFQPDSPLLQDMYSFQTGNPMLSATTSVSADNDHVPSAETLQSHVAQLLPPSQDFEDSNGSGTLMDLDHKMFGEEHLELQQHPQQQHFVSQIINRQQHQQQQQQQQFDGSRMNGGQRAVAKVAPMFRQLPESVVKSPVKSAPSTPTKKRRGAAHSAAAAVVSQYIKTEPAVEFEEETIMVDGRPMLKCPSCERTFPFRSKLLEHMPSHSDHRRYKCDFPNCGRAYKYKYDLNVHLGTHYGITTKARCCAICQQSFNTRKGLLDHMITLHNSDELKSLVPSADHSSNGHVTHEATPSPPMEHQLGIAYN